MTFDFQPTDITLPIFVGCISRLPPGDVYSWGGPSSILDGTYGTPVANQRMTIRIPFSKLTLGFTEFTGSIVTAGGITTLTVTSVQSGVGVDAGGFVTGPGIPAGTYITGHGQVGTIGTFTIGNSLTSIASLNVTSEAMMCQRTNVYKCGVALTGQASGNTYYLNNLGFTSANATNSFPATTTSSSASR